MSLALDRSAAPPFIGTSPRLGLLATAGLMQWADGLCAAMALGSGVFAAVSMRPRREGSSLVPQFPMSIVAVAVTALSVAGMVTASTHIHAHGETGVIAGDGHDHAHEA